MGGSGMAVTSARRLCCVGGAAVSTDVEALS